MGTSENDIINLLQALKENTAKPQTTVYLIGSR